MKAPRAILFDFGGTLLQDAAFDPVAGLWAVLELAKNPRGVAPADVLRVADEIRGVIDPRREASPFEMSFVSYLRLLFERLGLTSDTSMDELTVVFWKGAVQMTPEPGVVEAIRALPGELRLGVVSNSTMGERSIRHELARHQLLASFEFVMASAEYGLRKPEALLFRTALGRLEVDPSDAWFVGDSLRNDVAGAQSAGMRAIWYAPDSARSEGASPDGRFSAWSDFAALLHA